jgi:hypothetical protein
MRKGDVLVPFNSLEVLPSEPVRENEASHGITALKQPSITPFSLYVPHPTPRRKKRKREANTHKISTVRIHLATIIALEDVDLGLVDEAHDLDVVRGLYELNTCQRTGGDEAGSMPGLGAPCDHGSLDVADFAPVFGGCPEAEICGRGASGQRDNASEENRPAGAKQRREQHTPSSPFMNDVWHSDFGPSVVELQMLYPSWVPRTRLVSVSTL